MWVFTSYDGAVHGEYIIEPFNYSFEKEGIIGIKGVLDGSQEKLETLSQIVRSDLEERDDIFHDGIAEYCH